MSNWGGANRVVTSNTLGAPSRSEGTDGDMQVRQTNLGAKIFAKIGGIWLDSPLSVGGVTKFGASPLNYLSIDRDSIDIIKGQKRVASFGASMRIGEDSTSKSALRVASDGALTIGQKGASANFSVAADGTVSISSDDISLSPTPGDIEDGDSIIFIDANDSSSTKKDALRDLATLFAGDGMTATNSVMNVIGSNGITANANDIALINGLIADGSNITSLGTIGSGVWEGTTIAVDQGGTGATTLNNLITMGTHTTGNYVATLTAGALIDLQNNSGETASPTVDVDLTEASEAAIANGDYILFLDGGATGTHAKEAIADVATLFAGVQATTGLTSSSSTLVLTDLHPVGVSGSADQLLTDDGDGTVTSESTLVYTSTGLGIGTTAPDKTLEINSGANDNNHIRLAYNDANGSASVYADISCTSGGNLALAPTGDITLDPTGNDVLPATAYDINLGSASKKYLSLRCAELRVDTLVAAGVMSTIGGRILVAPTTELIIDINTSVTTIDVKHDNLTTNDLVIMEGGGNFECIKIGSTPATITGGFRYTSCTRNYDASGTNSWVQGDAVVNTGNIGDGWIDIYAENALNVGANAGPTIVGNVRSGIDGFSSYEAMWAIGNLDGYYGLGNDQPGVGIGKYSGEHLLVQSGSIKFRDSTVTKMDITGDEIKMYANDGVSVVSRWSDQALAFAADLTNAPGVDAIYISTFGVQVYGDTPANYVSVNNAEVKIHSSVNDKCVIDNTGMTVTSGGVTRLTALDTGVTLYGADSTDHLNVTTGGVDIYTNDARRLTLVDAGLTISSGNLSSEADGDVKSVLSSSGLVLSKRASGSFSDLASFGDDTVITGGTITLRNATNNDCKTILAENSFKIYDNIGATIATFAATSYLGRAGGEHIKITNSSLELKDGPSTTYVSIGATSTFGKTSSEHISITDGTLELKDGPSTTYVSIGATSTFGKTTTEHIEITGSSMKFIDGGESDQVMMELAAGTISLTGQVKVGKADGSFNEDDNISIGQENSNLGTYNVSIGYKAGEVLSALSSVNVIIGYNAGLLITGATLGNTCIGTQTGDSITSGSNNTCIGYQADVAGTYANQIAIGNGAVAYTSNTCAIGNASIANIHPADDEGVDLGNATYGFNDIHASGSFYTSDIRLKEDITSLSLGLEFINKLNPVSYKRKDVEETYDGERKTQRAITYKRKHAGLIAQEVKQVMDDMSIDSNDFAGYADANVNAGVDKLFLRYTEFIAPIIKAVQELSAKMDTMQTEINNLKAGA